MSHSAPIAALADQLWQAEQLCQPIPPLRDRLTTPDADTAYAIQNHNTERALAAGRRLVGRKIGLTSLAVQAQLGVDQPDFGMLFADMAIGDGEAIATGRLIQPKVEAEIALVLGRDLTHKRHTYADLIRATDYALPAIEVVDSRIAHWNIRFVDTVADNASSGLFVLGSQPRRLGEFDLAACAMEMRRGDEVVSSGNGRACLGNPLGQLRSRLRAGQPGAAQAQGVAVQIHADNLSPAVVWRCRRFGRGQHLQGIGRRVRLAGITHQRLGKIALCAGRGQGKQLAGIGQLGKGIAQHLLEQQQIGPQLLDLGHQRRDGIARRVALDAQRLHLIHQCWASNAVLKAGEVLDLARKQ